MTEKRTAHAYMRITSRMFQRAQCTYKSSMSQRSDEGSMLVEVLVALLLLVVVFTSTTYALSGLAAKRLAVEQRDRAVALITEREELTRVLRCGLVVDKGDSTDGIIEFNTKITSCDGGDFDTDITQSTGSGGQQVFHLRVRYWWEQPGTDLHRRSCSTIRNEMYPAQPGGYLPSILVRAFEVTWREKGQWYRQALVKKDPVPVDNAVFATGNRANFLVGVSPGETVTFGPTYTGPKITRIVAGEDSGRGQEAFPGQPEECVWFPYVGLDDSQRYIGSTSDTSVKVAGEGILIS